MNDRRPSYSFMAKALHWAFVVLFIYGVVKAVEDVDQLQESSFLRFEVLFASVFLLLLVVRYQYMKKKQKSSLPVETSQFQKMAARTVHLAMYGTLGLIALTGLVIGLLFWLGFTDGFLIEAIIAIHEFGIPIMYWLIAIHVTAAIYHRLLKDGVWTSMVPFWREND